MANYKKVKSAVKNPFTYKDKFYKKDDVFEGKKEVIEGLKYLNLLK